jgi:phi13 family phage major tail protein
MDEAINYRYGIRGATIAMLNTQDGTYGTPWKERGAESVEESAPTQNSTTFYSDDGNGATVNGATGSPTINVQFAEFSKDYNEKCLGHRTDETTGATIKNKNDVAAPFAFGYEMQGTAKKTRVWKLGCTSSEPVASSATNGENVTEAPQSCTLTINGNGLGDYEFVSHEGDPAFATFLDAVPTIPAQTNDGNSG